MDCFCIDKFDFIVINDKPDEIVFIDISEWRDKPPTYLLSIISLWADDIKQVVIKTGNYINRINVKDIYPKFDKFPDGEYKVSVTLCGVTHIDYFLRTNELDCKLANLAISPPHTDCYLQALMYRNAAHAATKCEACSIEKLRLFYKQAKTLIEHEEFHC